jgi:peptidoglycan hydrolase CwlO-like protein
LKIFWECLRRLDGKQNGVSQLLTPTAIMGKKNYRKTIRSLQRRITEHEDKIELEQKKDLPDQGLIHHWQKEIRAFEKGIQQAQKRLGK